MKKKLLIFVIAILATLVTACSSTGSGDSSSDDSSSIYRISIGTGTTTGTYYPLGAVFSSYLNGKIDNVQVSSQATNGSVQNMQFIKTGEAQLGFVPAGTVYEGYHGLGNFKGNEIENATIIAGLYTNLNHLVARKGIGIESMEDLEGKKIVPGAIGSYSEIGTQQLLRAHGIDYDTGVKKSFVGFTEATDLMRNKQIDAAMVMGGVPVSAVTEMLATANGELLSYSDEAITKITEEYPWTIEYIIEAGSYDNQPEDVKSIAEYNYLVAPSEMPEDVAYELVKAFWENIDEIRGSHAAIEELDVNNALKGVGDLPIHPGAAKYYEEVGVSGN